MGYLSPSPPIAKPSPPPLKSNDPSHMSLESLGPFLLDSKDLQIARPGAIELLYSAEPLQCKQCGFRYPKTDKGQAKMDAHLDSHFRQNRKMKERVKRGLSRSWFVTEEEWINGEGGELMSQQGNFFLICL
jgi:pre-mRNA cleavage complex 2 protein Pcf11